MVKYTKKWDKEFSKRYSDAIIELQSLEKEFKQMKEDNPDVWISIFPKESQIEFGNCDGQYVSHSKEDQYGDETKEHVNVTLRSELGMFSFDFYSFEDVKKFRNDIIEAVDEFNRPVDVDNTVNPDECEDEEGWEDNEEQEYTIQCSRTCVESWTHTVMARSTCEAYRMAQEGEGNDENSDYNDYGDIDYESI